MSETSAVLASYSLISCLVLCLVYLVSLPQMEKTFAGKLACAGLMLALAMVQAAHVLHFIHGTDLLSLRAYVLLLALVPIAFFMFSRELLFHESGVNKGDALHLVLLVLVLLLPLKLAALATFVAGCGYTFFIYRKIVRLRKHIPRFQFERFFFALFFAMNVVALCLGLLIQFLTPEFFYHAYAGCISVAMILVTTALLMFPELLSDVLLASETVYAQSKLGNIDVDLKRLRLERLMLDERLFEDEGLTLASVAEQLDVSSQQLSELVNSSFGLSFPRYIRQHRVEAARQMLLDEPDASVLSISLANGFKSQSSFYSAFKEQIGVAPAAFRKAQALKTP